MTRPIYDHAFSIAFSLKSYDPDGDVTPKELRDAVITRLANVDDNELIEAVGAPFDTHLDEPAPADRSANTKSNH